MVLADLGRKLNGAIASLTASSAIDEQALDVALKTISAALLESDVNVRLVKTLRDRVKVKVLPQLEEIQKRGTVDALAGNKAKQLLQRAVYDELVALVDPGDVPPPAFNPKKGKSSVIMMVGLQGAGKTTTCTKLATHYTRRGLKTALVCADTFRAGAFDQLKQNAVKAKIPFFGRQASSPRTKSPWLTYTETDPVAISLAGVTKFRSERFDVIIVDTSGRHRQESELFEEMVQISQAVEPDMTVLVLDGAIGQAAEAQSRAFKDASNFGAIIVTKLDGHAKGGGAISAVAATKTPIIFIGTGEHLHDLEKFSPQPFISKMLGMGDMQGLLEQAQEVAMANPERQENLMKKLEKGEFTIRDLKDQLQTIMNMGPLSKIASMIPGMGDMLGGGNDKLAAQRMKRIAFIFDSMTQEELDSDGALFRDRKKRKQAGDAKGKKKASLSPSELQQQQQIRPRRPNRRVLRVARGSGTSVNEVEELLSQHQMFAQMVKKAGGKSGWMSKMQGAGRAGARPGSGMPGLGPGGMPDLSKLSPSQMSQMAGMLPPGMRQQLQQPGAMAEMQKMMASMGGGGAGGGGFPGLGGLGGGGMPDMSKLMGMFGSGR
ncbi:Signal recognition particle [Microbotryomycetes sp. JL201]|nr:Signal recognition particle [Microbotryomycetes sp. JL201]